MPIQLGGPSLSKPKKPKTTLDPFGVPHVGAQVLPSLAASKPLVPQVTIPKANSIVAPQTFANPATGAAGGQDTQSLMDAIKSDPFYSIGESNYQNALNMGERQYLADPFKQAYITYGYDIPSYNEKHPGVVSGDILAAAQKYLDPTAQKAMQDNEFSVSRQLNRSFGQAIGGIAPNQAARGMFGSGGADIEASNASYQLGQQEKQAMDQFLGSLGTANSNWLNYRNQQAETWRAAQQAIADRLARTPGDSGMPEDPSTIDYSGGPASVFQPAPDVGALMAKDQAAGQWDSWASAMGKTTAAANKPSPATQKAIKKVKQSIQPSAMSKALSGLTGW